MLTMLDAGLRYKNPIRKKYRKAQNTTRFVIDVKIKFDIVKDVIFSPITRLKKITVRSISHKNFKNNDVTTRKTVIHIFR